MEERIPDYEKMYKTLFNSITDATHLIMRAALIMQTAQDTCENLYIEPDESSDNN